MALTYSNIDFQLTNSTQIILTSSSSVPLIITRITAVNTDTAPHNFSLWRVAQGTSPSLANVIVDSGNWPGVLAAGEMVVIPLSGHSLVQSQTLQGACDTGGVVNISISYAQSS